MGQLHNELRRTALSKALKLALGDTRGDGGIERYGETLQPIVDLWRQPEFGVLRDEIPWARSVLQAAIVGELGGVAVVNPAGSNMVVMIDRGTAANGTAGGAVLAGLATEAVIIATYANAPNNTRDTRARVTNNQPPFPQIWAGTDAAGVIAAGFSVELITSPTALVNVVFVTAVPCVLEPGMALVAQGNAVNQSVLGCWAGRVRVALPGELLL